MSKDGTGTDSFKVKHIIRCEEDVKTWEVLFKLDYIRSFIRVVGNVGKLVLNVSGYKVKGMSVKESRVVCERVRYKINVTWFKVS